MTIVVIIMIGGLNLVLGYLLAVLIGRGELRRVIAAPTALPASTETGPTFAPDCAVPTQPSLPSVASLAASKPSLGKQWCPSDFSSAVDDFVVRLCDLRARLVGACERSSIAEFCACETELQILLEDWVSQCTALTEQVVRPLRGRQWQRDVATRLENASLAQCAQSETSLSNLRQWQTESPSYAERTRVVQEADRVVISLEVLARDAKHLFELLATLPAA